MSVPIPSRRHGFDMSVITSAAGRAGSPAASGRPARAASKPAAPSSVSRKDFTDRLGLPEDATNAEILASVDEKLAAKVASSAWGSDAAPAAAAAPTVRASTVDELYAAAWGEDQ